MGLSKLVDLDAQSKLKTFCGTLLYLAPEVLKSRVRGDGRYGQLFYSFFSTHACCKSRHEINCVIDPTWKLQLRPRSRQLVARCHSLRHDLGHASLQPGTQRQGFDATGKNPLTLFLANPQH